MRNNKYYLAHSKIVSSLTNGISKKKNIYEDVERNNNIDKATWLNNMTKGNVIVLQISITSRIYLIF